MPLDGTVKQIIKVVIIVVVVIWLLYALTGVLGTYPLFTPRR